MLRTLLLVGVAASQASAATIRVNVGRALVFSPSSITAAVGDVLEFHFLGGVHDVARGDFNKACEPAAEGGFYSGIFRPQGGVESPDVFRVTVTSTDPIFFYCSVESHCSGGMVGVVNPTSGQTLDAYKNAASQAIEVAPAGPFGGQIGPAGSFPESAPADAGSPAGSGSPADSGSPAGSGSSPGLIPAASGAATGAPGGSPTGSTKPSQSSRVSVSGAGVHGITKVALAVIVGVAGLAMF